MMYGRNVNELFQDWHLEAATEFVERIQTRRHWQKKKRNLGPLLPHQKVSTV
jgi:hypothetical protein